MTGKAQRIVRTEDGYFELADKPSAEELRRYYNQRYYGSDGSDGSEQDKNPYSYRYTDDELQHKTLAAAEALHLYRHHQATDAATPTAYEVGVGEGFSLKYLADHGFEVRGVDFTTDGLRAYHPELAGAVVAGDVYPQLEREIEGGRRYDLVICNHVLEHVIDPPDLLRRMRDIVAPGGLCRIQVPNDGSWLQAAVVDKGLADPEFWVCAPDHLAYFTAPSLTTLCERTGWRVVDLLGDFPIDVFLLNPDSCYTRERSLGRNCHFARVAFELGLWRQSIDALLAFRRGCARSGTGRTLSIYLSPPDPG